LTGATLDDATLTRADLTGAHLNGAFLFRATLTGANLTNAYLTGAHLTGAQLDGARLAGVHYDEKTAWPAGLRRRSVDARPCSVSWGENLDDELVVPNPVRTGHPSSINTGFKRLRPPNAKRQAGIRRTCRAGRPASSTDVATQRAQPARPDAHNARRRPDQRPRHGKGRKIADMKRTVKGSQPVTPPGRYPPAPRSID
jgi:hypothetical protein